MTNKNLNERANAMADRLVNPYAQTEPQKVYIVLWSGTYEDNGHHSVHRTQEGAQAEADRKNAEEEAYMKERPHAYPRNWYEIEEMDLEG